MSDLDPSKIFIAYQKNDLDKSSTVDYLRAFIEESDDEKLRIDTIFFLSVIGSDSNGKVSEVLENSLLSDQSSAVRAFAAKAIIRTGLIKNRNLIKYVIDTDTSVLVTTTIFKSLKKIKSNSAKELRNTIVDKYAKFHSVIPEEAKFLVDLYGLEARVHDDFHIDQTFLNRHVSIYYPEYDPAYADYGDAIIPELLVQGGRIKAINFFFWDLPRLPESISSLEKLEYLIFSAYHLTKSPKSFDKLSNLKWVEIAGYPKNRSRPNFIPEWFFNIAKRFQAQTYVKEGVKKDEADVLGLLDLITSTKIQKCEDDESVDDNYENICEYKQDKDGHVIGLYIFTWGYTLTILPEQIGELKWLIDLDLRDNKIREIPESIARLTSLKFLNLGYNKLQTIPESMASLKSLEYINLYGNNIKEVPKTIRDLESNSKGSRHYFA